MTKGIATTVGFLLEISIHQTSLYALVVLILAGNIGRIFAIYAVIINLANTNPGIYAYRLHTVELQRPVAFKTNIAKPGANMDAKPKAANTAAAF